MNYKIPLWLWVVLLLLFPVTFPLAVLTIPVWVPLLIWQSRIADREVKQSRAWVWTWNGTAWVPTTAPPPPSR